MHVHHRCIFSLVVPHIEFQRNVKSNNNLLFQSLSFGLGYFPHNNKEQYNHTNVTNVEVEEGKRKPLDEEPHREREDHLTRRTTDYEH